MSLVQFTRTAECAEHFDPLLRRLHRWSPNPDVKVPRRVESRRAGVVATAFDYALRIEVGRRHPSALEWPWQAEDAVICSQPVLATDDGLVRFATLVRDRFFGALGEARRYRSLTRPTRVDRLQLARACLDLASLDVLGRMGVILGDPNAVINPPRSEREVEEVATCLDIVPASLFETNGPVLIGPTFGTFGSELRGADADLVIGSKLIEVKCVDSSSIGLSYQRQLLGYFLLSELLADDGGSRQRVEELCVYFARHGRSWRVEAEQIRRMPEFSATKDRFRKWACGANRLASDDSDVESASIYTGRDLVAHPRSTAFAVHASDSDDLGDLLSRMNLREIKQAKNDLRKAMVRGRKASPHELKSDLFVQWGSAAPERVDVGTSPSQVAHQVRVPSAPLASWLVCHGATVGTGARFVDDKYLPFDCAWLPVGSEAHETFCRLLGGAPRGAGPAKAPKKRLPRTSRIVRTRASRPLTPRPRS